MNWNKETETRFSELRQKELASGLNKAEKEELAKLYAILDADEKNTRPVPLHECVRKAW